MSFRVLVVTEDFRRDQFIARPLVERIANEFRSQVLVEVCRRPKLGGIAKLFSEAFLREEILALYPMFDVIVLLADRDGAVGRERSIGEVAKRLVTPKQKVIGTAMIEELEIIVLAGHPTANAWDWRTMRGDPDIKNTYFRRLVEQTGTAAQPFEGRAALMKEAMRNWTRIKTLCVEDVGALLRQFKAME